MNPYRTYLISSLPLLAFSSPLLAIEAPDDETPPPIVEPAADEKAESKAFIGVISQPVPDLLRDHLNLKEHQGVLIKSLIPEGPADQAGIGVNDVLTGVDGVDITGPEVLSNVIGMHKPGDKVSCAVIQHGKAAQLEVTLSERPDQFQGIGRNMDQVEEPLNELGLPQEFADRIRQMMENENRLGMRMFDGNDMMQMEEMEKMRRQMKGKVREMRLELGKEGNFGGFKGGTKVHMKDGDGSVEIESKNGSKEVTVKDKEGETIWSGPWDTAQDKASAPDEIRARIERIDGDALGGGLKLNFGPFNR